MGNMPQHIPVKRMNIEKAKTLRRHQFIFKTLSSVGKKRRDIILKNAPLSLFKAIKTLFNSILKGYIPLKETHKRALQPHKRFIREQAISNHSKIKKRITQKGSGLASILKTVLPIIAPIITSFL